MLLTTRSPVFFELIPEVQRMSTLYIPGLSHMAIVRQSRGSKLPRREARWVSPSFFSSPVLFFANSNMLKGLCLLKTCPSTAARQHPGRERNRELTLRRNRGERARGDKTANIAR